MSRENKFSQPAYRSPLSTQSDIWMFNPILSCGFKVMCFSSKKVSSSWTNLGLGRSPCTPWRSSGVWSVCWLEGLLHLGQHIAKEQWARDDRIWVGQGSYHRQQQQCLSANTLKTIVTWKCPLSSLKKEMLSQPISHGSSPLELVCLIHQLVINRKKKSGTTLWSSNATCQEMILLIWSEKCSKVYVKDV